MDDDEAMAAAIEAAAAARRHASPNPWVGAVVTDGSTILATGATEPPGRRHAEIVALDALAQRADADARGATLVTTLEPCHHQGRTGPCTERIIPAGIRRVVVGTLDPDPAVAGRGIAALHAAGVEVTSGVRSSDVERQLAPYLTHRRTGRPYVVCKLATTLDGATAAPDGTSKWITGDVARRDVHRLRAESDAVVVGAGTVRADDPELTVRHVDGRDPLRVVLGSAPTTARVRPCVEWQGELGALLDDLGRRGVLQVLVEGGARVAASFHEAGLVDRYVFYVAPALLGGPTARPTLDGTAAPTMAAAWRGRIDAVTRLGDDVRIDVLPAGSHDHEPHPRTDQEVT